MSEAPRHTVRKPHQPIALGSASRAVRRSMILFLTLSMALAESCGRPASTPRAPVLLRLAGSTTMQPLLTALTVAYSELHPQATFDIVPVGSSAGLEQLRRGNADLALVSRQLQPEEERDPHSGERLLAATIIAYDSITVIVNAANPVGNLTLYELRNVFEGRVTRWDELGGVPEEIVVISREDGSGTRVAFEDLVMYGRRMTQTAIIMPGSEAMRHFVATHTTALGYLSSSLVQPGVKAVAIDGVSPSRQTVEDGTYPIVRPLLLVSVPEPDTEVAAFLQFARSSAGQAIVRHDYAGARSTPR